MKYYETLIEDQETTISILYEQQTIKIYSSEPMTIQKLIRTLGQPSTKYIKSKAYWSGASWEINFFDADKIKQILHKDIFIDKDIKKTKPKLKKSNKIEEKKNFEQIKIIF